MKANVISSPTFRFLQGNDIEVEFKQVNPKPWGRVDEDTAVEELNRVFENQKMGISPQAIALNREKANYRYAVDVKEDRELEKISFAFTKEKDILLDEIKIQAQEGTKSSFLIDYSNIEEGKSFRNSSLYIYAKQKASVDIYIVTRQNNDADIWHSLGIVEEEEAKVNVYQVEQGFGHKVFACYGSLRGKESHLNLQGSYFLEKQDLYNALYHVDLYGKQTHADIVVNGIQKDFSRKTFKGTLDFKPGCVSAVGSEAEYVTLLDETVKSKTLPIILCGEEYIEGNHAASAGQIDESMLFYIMSRGFSRQEAIGLIVEARLIPVIDKIPDEELKDTLLKDLRSKMTRG